MSPKPAAGLNLGYTEWDRRANVEENRRRFFHKLGVNDFSLASLRQIHSAEIWQALPGAPGEVAYRPSGHPSPRRLNDRSPAGDALLTGQPGILLSIRSADCVPVLLVDPRCHAIAAVHAGWRGALQRIVEKTAGEMRRMFGSQPRQLLAAVGPSIRACCYEVGEELVAAFRGRFVKSEPFFRKAPLAGPSAAVATRYSRLFLPRQAPEHAPRRVSALHLDLAAVARHQLQSAGLLLSNIHVADFCTACRTDLFFSHRREGNRTGRLMAVTGVRPGR